MHITFPYDWVEPLEVPDSNVLGIYKAPKAKPSEDIHSLVRVSLENPIGSPPLHKLVSRTMDVLIVVDDYTRTTKVKHYIKPVIRELEKGGVVHPNIKIFMAVGTHRKMTNRELRDKLGDDVLNDFEIINPDWHDENDYVHIGNLPEGDKIKVHKAVTFADFVIGIGQALPHCLAGFGGGGKIILPGCSDAATVGIMHWASTPYTAEEIFGVRDNPVREVIDEVSTRANLKFIVNEVSDADGNICGVFSGDPLEAHRQGCAFARNVLGTPIPEEADIVISDAYPADVDFWQAIKGLFAASFAVKKGGVIICVTTCDEGVSSQHPELVEYGYPPLDEIDRLVNEKVFDKVFGANMILGRRIIDKASSFLITRCISKEETEKMGYLWAPSAADALKTAFEMKGHDATINILTKAAKMLPLIGNGDNK